MPLVKRDSMHISERHPMFTRSVLVIIAIAFFNSDCGIANDTKASGVSIAVVESEDHCHIADGLYRETERIFMHGTCDSVNYPRSLEPAKREFVSNGTISIGVRDWIVSEQLGVESVNAVFLCSGQESITEFWVVGLDYNGFPCSEEYMIRLSRY